MDKVIAILAFIFVMGVIVFVHELGHLLAAKKYGVYCSEFAIGMGPKLFSIKGKETKYTLRLLPIGGFVAMAGEEENQEGMESVPFERTLNGIKKRQKIVILLAGIFMNILLAFVINTGIYLYQGKARVEGPITVVDVSEQSNASKIGFKKGDQLTKIILENNKEIVVKDFNDALTYLVADRVEKVVVLRENKEVVLNYIRIDSSKTTSIDGLVATPSIREIKWYESVFYAVKKIGNDATTILRTLSNLIRGIGLRQISGPVGIFNVVGNAANSGLLPLFALLSLLSLNIGLFNAIPIPALDGGRVVLTILERLLGKYYNKKIETYLIMGSFFLLLGLILFTVLNDIFRLI